MAYRGPCRIAAAHGVGQTSDTRQAARTICRWLSPEQHHDYQAWIDNDRRLRELLTRLEALGAAALEADPRWQHNPLPRSQRYRPDHSITAWAQPA